MTTNSQCFCGAYVRQGEACRCEGFPRRPVNPPQRRRSQSWALPCMGGGDTMAEAYEDNWLTGLAEDGDYIPDPWE